MRQNHSPAKNTPDPQHDIRTTRAAIEARMVADSMSGHVWNEPRSLIVGEHGCYFCTPELYPPMKPRTTLCACCGDLIDIDRFDPMNEWMSICDPCDKRFETSDE